MYAEEVLVQNRPGALLVEDESIFFFLDSEDQSALHKCLVVDDDPFIMRLVAEMLADLDYRVDMAKDGLQALRAMSTGRYDLVVTDLEMPIMSGYHLASRVKEKSRDTKIIIMTGHCQNELADLMNAGPVDAWLFKPFGLNELCSVLNSLELPSSEQLHASRTTM
ncbi:MAG: response regulator [Desulfobacteraceae bacterium]|nr:MAG: response regulator [Desulfobacteraceae bacterium]